MNIRLKIKIWNEEENVLSLVNIQNKTHYESIISNSMSELQNIYSLWVLKKDKSLKCHLFRKPFNCGQTLIGFIKKKL